MTRTELFNKLRGFDPRFFLYWEETDLCKRAEELGFEIWTFGEALAVHVGGASSTSDESRVGGCIAKHYYQSRFYYMLKHHGRLAASIAEIIEFTLLCIMSGFDLIHRQKTYRLRQRLQARLFSQP